MKDFYNENETNDNRFDKPKTEAFSLICLIFGTIALLSCWTGKVIPVIFGVLAVAFAIVARLHLGYFDSKGVVGLIFGIIGFAVGLVMLILTVTAVIGALRDWMESITGGGDAPDINTTAFFFRRWR